MNPEVKESDRINVSTPELKVTTDSPLVKVNAEETTSEIADQLQQIWAQVNKILSGLPELLSDFFGEYKRPLMMLGLIFGSVVSVKLTLAMLDAVNDIPLLAPAFELVGIGYTIWFIIRYLWKAESRQELSGEVTTFKDQVLGKKS